MKFVIIFALFALAYAAPAEDQLALDTKDVAPEQVAPAFAEIQRDSPELSGQPETQDTAESGYGWGGYYRGGYGRGWGGYGGWGYPRYYSGYGGWGGYGGYRRGWGGYYGW